MATSSYPMPRPRDAAAAAAALPASAGPTASSANRRNFPFALRSAGGVNVVVSPQFVGNGIINELVLGLAVGAANPLPTVQLYISDDNSGGGVGFAQGTQPTGEPVFDLNDQARDDGITPQDRFGIELFNMSELQSGFIRFRIGRVTRKSKFFVKIRLATIIAGGTFMHGHVNVTENVSDEALAGFL